MKIIKDIKDKMEVVIDYLNDIKRQNEIMNIKINKLNNEIIDNKLLKEEIKRLKEEIERYKLALTKTTIQNKDKVKSWLRSED